jgi:hypothetical protein
VNAGPVPNNAGNSTSGGSIPPNSAHSPSGNTNFSQSPHSQEVIHAHGTFTPNYQAGGPIHQKRDSISTVRALDATTNSISSPSNERNSLPLQSKPSGPVEFSSNSNAEQTSENPQSLYSKPPYPQFVSSQSGSINLPPLNLANRKNSSSHENVHQASGSPVSKFEPGA